MINPKHYIISAIIWFIIISILSVIPDNTPNTIPIVKFEMRLDYLLHFLVYLPLGFTLMNWKHLSKKKANQYYFIALLILMSLIPEILQLFIPYRTFNHYDLLFNLAGVLFGIIIVQVFIKTRIKR